MNFEALKQAVNSNAPSTLKRMVILDIIAQDEKAIVDILEILNTERMQKSALILEMNMQLSRADVFIQNPNIADKEFISGEIEKFYDENKNYVSHCFKEKSQTPRQ